MFRYFSLIEQVFFNNLSFKHPKAYLRTISMENTITHTQYATHSIIQFTVSKEYLLPPVLLTLASSDIEYGFTLLGRFFTEQKDIQQSGMRESFLSDSLTSVTQAIEKKNSDALTEVKRGYEKELSTLKRQLAELQADLTQASKSESLIRDQERAASDRIIAMMEKKNKELLEAKEATLAQRELTLQQKESELHTKILRQSSSSLRGQDGESYFENIAKEKMNWNLQDTSKLPHACDYQATIHNVKSMFEVKHYTHPVPQKEVTKFLRDMKENPGAHFGAFLSLNTHIQGHNPNQSISIDWVNTNQCVVYIQKCAELDIDTVFWTLDEIIKITSVVTRLINDSQSSQEPVYQSRIEKAKAGLEQSMLKVNDCIRKLKADRQQYLTIIESNMEARVSDLRVIASSLSRSLEILLGESVECEEIEETVPAKSKKRTPTKKKGSAPVIDLSASPSLSHDA